VEVKFLKLNAIHDLRKMNCWDGFWREICCRFGVMKMTPAQKWGWDRRGCQDWTPWQNEHNDSTPDRNTGAESLFVLLPIGINNDPMLPTISAPRRDAQAGNVV
jgi:hypothetical protein